MIFYSSQEGFIKPRGIKNNNGIRDTSIKLPHIAVGVFSEYLLKDIASKFECKKVGELTEKRPVYELKYKNAKITLFMAGISGPWISADIEELNINGVDTFIIFGNCGVLDKDIEDSFINYFFVYHYLPDSEYIKLDETYKNLFKDILKEYNFNYNEGATWTIDAFYRETKEKIERYQKKGVICVEMEGASIGAVCQYKKLKYFTFYYAGDNLDSVEWEERSINQLANFNKKTKVPILALELAYKIENNKQKNNL